LLADNHMQSSYHLQKLEILLSIIIQILKNVECFQTFLECLLAVVLRVGSTTTTLPTLRPRFHFSFCQFFGALTHIHCLVARHARGMHNQMAWIFEDSVKSTTTELAVIMDLHIAQALQCLVLQKKCSFFAILHRTPTFTMHSTEDVQFVFSKGLRQFLHIRVHFVQVGDPRVGKHHGTGCSL